ncbi:MAG: dihydroorotate dehydrogenase [Dehalococcoidaceae bacterium]|nr:dihydroorotate dehydrogenase [Dehalococcoidaceae bacterium]
MDVNFNVELAGSGGRSLNLKNPLLLASGTCGYASDLEGFTDLSVPGGFISKGTTLKPREGNPQPRIAEVEGGMLNSIGLENAGIEAIVRQKAPVWRKLGLTVIVNIAGSSIDEYVTTAASLEGVAGIAGIELNISCPNVKAGGEEFGMDPATAAAVTRAVRDATGLPLFVKLTPGSGRVSQVAAAVASAGADAVTLINTFKGMAIDIRQRKPLLGNITGGLSGPVLKPVALAMVYETAGIIDIPIIACGGISSARDALEFIMAGAHAFQVGTAFMVNPALPAEILAGMKQFLQDEGVEDINQLVGCARA